MHLTGRCAGPPRAAAQADDPCAAAVDVVLHPGEYFVGGASHRVRTVLGSCVSVTLWAPPMRIGAMSHCLLSTRETRARCCADTAAPEGHVLDARYGDEALDLMLRDLQRQGVDPSQCQAKIFGGGDMFPDRALSGALAVGRRNGEAARRLLQARGIQVVSESLFGAGFRQIVFDIGSGHVWSRQVRPNSGFGPFA